MRFKSKLKILLMLLISCVFFAFFSFGCNNDKPGTSNGGANKTDYLKINKSQVTVIMGETVLLEAKYNYRDNTQLVFSIDDSSVASVSESGLVTGIKAGQAIVTATYGESTDTCQVKVESHGNVPSLEFIYGVDDNVTCFVNDGINLGAQILFNGKEYTDMAMSYEFTDDSIAEVDEKGLLTAKKAGNTDVTVTASWRNFTKVKTIKLTVSNNVECYISDEASIISNIELDTLGIVYDGKTYCNAKEVEGTAVVNDTSVPYVLASTNEEVFTVEENSKVVAMGAGEAELELRFDYEGEAYNFKYAVSVKKPLFVAKENEEIVLFDATKGEGEKAFIDIFDDEFTAYFPTEGNSKATAVSAADGTETELTYNAADKKLLGVPVNANEKVKQTITIEGEKVFYQFILTPYTSVIRTVDEFIGIFAGGTADAEKKNSGYYILGNDITHSYKAIKHESKGSDFYDELAGTFDGNGYDISGIYCQNGGLFGDVTGTIKNVSLNISIDNYRNVQFTTLGKFTSTTNLENIYLKPTSFAKTNANKTINGLASSGMSCNVKMKNVVMDTTGLRFKSSNHEGSNDWQYFNPYCTNYDIFSTNGAASTNLDKLKRNQTNVYFVTEQYLSQFTLGSDKPHAIIEAGNKKEGWTYNSAYTGGIAEAQTETVFVDTFYRYDTSAAMAEATKAGKASDYADFTDTGLWNWDATNGLTWKGNSLS